MVGREILAILKTNESGKISKTVEATLTKIGFHAFHNNLYLHEFFEPILFFDPHGLSMVGREILAILKTNEKVAKSPKL